MKSIVVITPSMGTKFLPKAIESVKNQTYKNITHLIVGDGPATFASIMEKVDTSAPVKVTFAPENTGANGFYGHRIYAAYPHLINSDYICFLDEDNWFKPDHIESLVELIESKNLEWAYSLRDIHHPNGDFFIEDNCESIGKWPIFLTLDKPEKQYLVDTSSYCFKTEWIKDHCHYWHWGWGGDRRFYNIVKQMGDELYHTTGQHTLCYRLDDQVEKKYGSPQFFEIGNKIIKEHYGDYPWLTPKSSNRS